MSTNETNIFFRFMSHSLSFLDGFYNFIIK